MSVETRLLTPNEVCNKLSEEAVRQYETTKFANTIIRVSNGKMQDAVVVVADSDEECTERMDEIIRASGGMRNT